MYSLTFTTLVGKILRDGVKKDAARRRLEFGGGNRPAQAYRLRRLPARLPWEYYGHPGNH